MKRSYLKYITALLLFGSNGIVASFISLNSYEIVLLRTLLGSLLLLILFLLGKNKFTFFKHKNDFLSLCFSGVAMGVSWILLYEAYGKIGVSISSLLYYCGPVLVMILSPLLFDERLTAIKLGGFSSVFIGVFLLNLNAMQYKADTLGIFCGLMSAVMYSLMVIFNKKAKKIKGLENATLQLIVSFITVAVFVAIKQGFIITISTNEIFAIFILGLINTGVGCYFYFSSIGNLPVQSVAILGYLEPLSAVLFSIVFLGETMSLIQIIGTVLIFGGAIIGEFKIMKFKK